MNFFLVRNLYKLGNTDKTNFTLVYRKAVIFSYHFFCYLTHLSLLLLLLCFFFHRPHFRPKSPPTQVSLSSHSSSPVSSTDSPSVSKQTGEPRPRLHRSFSTQQRSKFSLNPTPTNGVVGLNFTHSNLSRNSLSNGPLSNQGGYTTGSLVSKNSAYSTAPMKAVYALNFPVNSGHSLSNSLVRGNAPFSPTALSSSSSASAALRASAAESSAAEQM